MKSFFNEFKEFILKGNAVSMAVGIVVGGAFTAIINSLVADIITPLLGIIIGGIDFTGIVVTVGKATLMVGNFIQAIIVFLLTAFALFLVVRAMNRFMDRLHKNDEPEEPAPVEVPEDIQLLREIRDSLKK